MTVPRGRPDCRRSTDEVIPLQNPFHSANVLRGRSDLAALSGQYYDLNASIPFQMHVRRELDVLSPVMLGRG